MNMIDQIIIKIMESSPLIASSKGSSKMSIYISIIMSACMCFLMLVVDIAVAAFLLRESRFTTKTIVYILLTIDGIFAIVGVIIIMIFILYNHCRHCGYSRIIEKV